MNRIEFIAELEKLLQEISAEERAEAIQYYKDYFEDAGLENEQHIIEELGSPQKVARTIREGLKGRSDENGEYRETGYADTRFEEKDMPAKMEAKGSYAQQDVKESPNRKPWSSDILKVVLIIAIVLVGAPIILPLGIALIAVVFAIVIAIFALFIGVVLFAVLTAVTGIIMVVAGIAELFAVPAAGLLACGIGLIFFVIGVVATVLLVKLCMIVFPAVFKGIVNICRRLFHKKEV